MKISRVVIESFKGIKGPLEIDFTGPDGQPRPLTCLLGDNGSGKTTVLQAIALTLGLAMKKFDAPGEFLWPGFLPGRIASFGKPRCELAGPLNEEEVALASALASRHALMFNDSYRNAGLPEDSIAVGEFVGWFEIGWIGGTLRVRNTVGTRHPLLARHYRSELAKVEPSTRFSGRLGDVIWFDQNRNIANTSADSAANGNGSEHPGRGWMEGVGELRKALVYDWLEHLSPRAADKSATFIGRLQAAMNTVFPGLEFYDAGRRLGTTGSSGDDVQVLFRRGERIFEIAEMSSGEQAVFPLMYEFVRQDIHNSVVLIDELELHLHPPQQQALLAAVRTLARERDCQFIITTHSDDVAGGIPEEHIFRMPGGRSCL